MGSEEGFEEEREWLSVVAKEGVPRTESSNRALAWLLPGA